jgi:ribosomal 30S subunit maturation factor RimM
LVFFGKISKIRGNKGEVILEPAPTCPDPKLKKNSVVLKIKGIDSIGEAFKIVGYSLFLKSVNFLPEQKPDWNHFAVRDIRDVFWGNVRGIRKNGLSQVIECEHAGEIIYIPVCDEIIREVSIERKLIIIDPPQGLRKLNR